VNVSPVIDIGKDTVLCDNESITLNPGNGFKRYAWSTGSTASSIVVNNSGVYSVAATAFNNCVSKDTLSITVKTTPMFSLGNDTVMCADQRLVLQPEVSGNYIWQNGTTGKQQTVSSPGLYWLKVSNDICSYTDSITVGIKPSPTVTLPPDTTLCDGASLVLSIMQPGASYLWNDGDIKSTKTVSGTGTYSITLTRNRCQGTDTINIVQLQSPVFHLGRDVAICMGDVYSLHVESGNVDYRWQDGSEVSKFDVKQAGTYYVTGSNYCGTYTDTIKVSTIQCSCSLDIANSFSPNNDGINDIFKPNLLCNPASYSLSIYNRFGVLLFDTRNYNNGWNGKFNGMDLPVGTYYYILRVQGQNDERDHYKAGSVTLLR
jgi:gliding motility-associated-like protein